MKMKVAVLWSGGKDSCLAYSKAMGLGHDVDCIVTFVGNKPFLCHPLRLMTLQSRALQIPHFRLHIKEPYRETYRRKIYGLIETRKIEGIVTGDISLVDAVHQNWIETVCEGLNIDVIKPLWMLSPPQIMNEIISSGVKAVFTCVKQFWFGEMWVGRELGRTALKDLEAISNRYGIHLCGENGEYHTMVTDAPMFQGALHISKFSKKKKNSLLFMKINEVSLKTKSQNSKTEFKIKIRESTTR
jgi:diphthine-ammonia ligase